MVWRMEHKNPNEMCICSVRQQICRRLCCQRLPTGNYHNRGIMLCIRNTAVFEIVLFTPGIAPVDRTWLSPKPIGVVVWQTGKTNAISLENDDYAFTKPQIWIEHVMFERQSTVCARRYTVQRLIRTPSVRCILRRTKDAKLTTTFRQTSCGRIF